MSGLKVEGFFVGTGSLTLNCVQHFTEGKPERTAVYLDIAAPDARAALASKLREAANEIERKAGH